MTTKYSLPISESHQTQLAVGWLYVAVGFLLASGIYPLLLALARTTYEMPWKDFFYTALVLHVDFTVLWWLIAIAGVFWTLNTSSRQVMTGWLSLLLVVGGGIIIGVSPLTGDANPLTNNYIPMLENKIFIKGLIVFGGGVLLLVLRSMWALECSKSRQVSGEGAIRFGTLTAAIAALIAMIALIWSFTDAPVSQGRSYYESLYWAGGHILQFAHTALLCVSWLWIAQACGLEIKAKPIYLMAAFAIGVAPVLMMPWPFLSYDIGGPEFMSWYVWLMRDGNGVAPLLIGLPVVWALLTQPAAEKGSRHLYMALLFSIVLFAMGGMLGLFIGESSTLITAHYHGSIVSVTMAFMAMTYYWLPKFGFANVNLKWARIQVYAYAIGQILHIVGLAWGGGHGMKRKVVGTTQDIGVQAVLTPQDLVGVGGVIAVLSGVLFAIVVLPVMLKGRKMMREEARS
ncbi:Heme/copper-type cytochrome/quinol oxidase, subunit 1 [Mariprofundus ferrinatatus]|uniref:Heme/copper-type cytochrome/quinol oxidase, subunit 1 n=1 Tax=Mariprofundus ferrinatatus TaxID=1921087 RepID=A0A2K8L2M1_9PROT|nr:cbb3-type cytochrome c oxidase subunit I [Mariprofundus ferrinatatus]ATX81580.1 Heme/copper-type cytochrome/quinol oxidase, subunit 1 [Mariprofundus ferrinatatus]